MDEQKLHLVDQRTEEVQDIIERMPTRFGFYVSMIVVLLFILFFIFGWVIRYPDIVTGQMTINATAAPIKLIANSSGKIRLMGARTMEEIKEGQIIAFVENPTSPANVLYIDSLLKVYNPSENGITALNKLLPKNFSLGELNPKYYVFANALQEYANYEEDKLYDKQGENFQALYKEQLNAITSANAKLAMAKNSLVYARKFYRRDSTLLQKKVISEGEMDKSELNYISSKDNLQNAMANLINAKQAAQQTKSRIQELNIQKPEKNQELRIALVSAYNDFIDNIKSWEQKYVFKAPMEGTLQFLKFYNENQFLQAGEEVFTIVPKAGEAFGQVILPAQGSGKIKTGQEVIVKLDNFPYLEYGSITGRVKSISLTTNTIKTQNNQVDTYMVLVDFPHQLKTNYGTQLAFKAEAKGSAEIITNDRRLIERLFDNLRYVMKK